MSEGQRKSEDLWNPYKDLVHTLTVNLESENKHLASIENILKKYKQNFFSLLQNVPKSAKSREELKKGMEDGITVRGIGYQTLSKELYQETLIISDMYDINEYVALDLLCTAQMQMPYYPGLPRGLVAVLLYYDGRKSLVTALRMLIQARKGTAWSLRISEDIESYITTYTDQLAENGLFNRIFDLLRTLDLSKEIEKLQQNVALGGPKHRKLVIDLFTSTKIILADCVLLWSVHSGLSKRDTLQLMHYLKEVKLEEDATGKLDDVNLLLQTAFLSAVDLSVLNTREDGEDVVQSLPILAENDFISTIHNELQKNKGNWESEGLYSLSLFGFGVCLSSLKMLPHGQKFQSIIEQEERIVEEAINGKVFTFLLRSVLESDTLHNEEFILKRFHNLFCDFLAQMYAKIRELRIKADEVYSTIVAYESQGLEAPDTLPHDFEHLLLSISKLYAKDPLKLELSNEFWSSLEANGNFNSRIPNRSVGLFKFLRSTGDMIPPMLFVPYLEMLASLSSNGQAARHCFNLLKQSGPGLSNTITWDHFFMSFNQYYTNLRQEAPLVSDTIYRHRNLSNFHKGITPQEIKGLQAVLILIKTVAQNDEFSRIALCEHPAWAPLTVLLGLVSCSVPIPLKAELLLTLAALSKSRETAGQTWNNLEASQILVTIPSTSSFQPRGIQTELDEIESRMEEYPLTIGILTLLDALTDFGVPRTLGAGPRKPGFDPYLTFIVNSIFLKLNGRPYKDPVQKWVLYSQCLKLFLKFLLQYYPEASDFPDNNKPNEFNAPPGFHIMLQMNSKSEFLNNILFIINEGVNLFDAFVNFPGQKQVEQSTLFCVKIIERALMLQNAFSELVATTNCPILLTTLNKLLLSINARTNKPDHVLNIGKYITYENLPQHSLVALKIFIHLTKSVTIHNQIMNILLTSPEVNTEIRAGIVEALDLAVSNDDDDSVYIEIKLAIFRLLKQCLGYKQPNLSHFLFGFDFNRDVSQTIFQLPGIMEFPRTCIHSLLGILSANSGSKQKLLEVAYHMLYDLTANTKTSTPVLKFLRMQPNFFQEHIVSCVNSLNNGIYELNQFSWLLRILAIEVKVSSRSNQLIHLKKLAFLLHGVDMKPAKVKDPFNLLNKENSDDLVFLPSKNLPISLISTFTLSVKEVITPNWDYFNTNVVDGILKSCQNETTNPPLIDVKKLHRILLEELGSLQNTTVLGQKQAVLQEVQKVLVHALNINNTRSTCTSILHFIDSWRQLTEVLVIYIPYEIIPARSQQLLIIHILEALLQKVSGCNLLLDVANYLSGAVLILLENLRRAHNKEVQVKKLRKEPIVPNTVTQNYSGIKLILDKIVEWLLNADVTAQKLRMNLYGSLISLLHLIKYQEGEKMPSTQSNLDDSLFVNRLDTSKYNLEGMPLAPDVFQRYGDKFVDAICHDAVSGQEVCKMLAMTAFGLIVNYSNNIQWILHLSRRGFLKHIIDGILSSDEELKSVLEPVPEDLYALYSYESKMSLLIAIATNRIGAEQILEQRLLACLSTMKVFDSHPHITKESSDFLQIKTTNLEPIENRYLQIFLPSLHLCSAILTSLGSDNKSAVSQIMYFLLSHLETVDTVLRAGNPSLPTHYLKELCLLSSIIARTANNDLISVLNQEQSTINDDNKPHLYRIQKLMLNLLRRFLLTENMVRELMSETDYAPNKNRLLLTLKIMANLLLYVRNIVANHGVDHAGVGVIFQPNLNNTVTQFRSKNVLHNENVPSLGIMVQHLINAVNHHHKEKFTLDYLNRRLCEVPDMNTADLKQIINTSNSNVNASQYDHAILKENALEVLTTKIMYKKMETDYCNFMIEHALYVIWIHLDYYMLKAIPRTKNFGLLADASASFNLDATLASASEAMWKVSTDDISFLKQGLVSIFNDSFSKQLIETAYDRSDADKGLLEVLLRKIKRLIKFVPVK